MGIGKDNNRYKTVAVFAALFLFLVSFDLKSQIFPLRTSTGNFIITKNKTPFLINGCSVECSSSAEELYRNLTQLSYHKINTLFVSFSSHDAVYKPSGKPERNLLRKIRALKRLIREASFRNMAVIISPYQTDSCFSFENKSQYLELLVKKVYAFNNVLWLLRDADLKDETLGSRINSRQLKGVIKSSSNAEVQSLADFLIVHDEELSDIRKPSLLYLRPGETVNDSLSHPVRNKIYTGMLQGASGVLTDYSETKAAKYPSFYLGELHTKQFKTMFDTLAWYQIKGIRGISGDNRPPNFPAAFDNEIRRTFVLITPSGSFPLDLSFYPKGAKLNWINTCTGEVYRSFANGKPDTQLFLAPSLYHEYCDWLLVIDSM